MKTRKCITRFILLLLILVMCFTTVIGCGSKKTEKDNTTAPSLEMDGAEDLQLPIVDEPLTLTFFKGLGTASATLQDLNEMELYQELERRTGIHIKFIHPPIGQEIDQYNIMIASGDFPDMISLGNNYVQDLSQVITYKIAEPLNDLVNKYAPNYQNALKKYPIAMKAVTTDSDELVVFSGIQPLPECWGITGFMIRQDWLDKLNLEMPETIDEWEHVLTAFRDGDPNGNNEKDEIPLSSAKNLSVATFAAAWGVQWTFYMDGGIKDGTIKYGPIEPAFKDYIIRMNNWYKSGLIDKNYLVTDRQLLTALVTQNRVGAVKDSMIRALGQWNAMMEDDPDFLMWPAPYPKLTQNSKVYYSNPRLYVMGAPATGVIITTTSKHKKEATKWMDYHFSEEGTTLFNFGVEDYSFKMINGKPYYTDLIINNPEGLTPADAAGRYTGISGAVFIQRPEYFEQLNGVTPPQRQAFVTWKNGWDNSNENWLAMPPITLLDSEKKIDSSRWNDIDTLANEKINKFIVGDEPIEKFDEFVNQIKGMGIDECIRIRQDAVERWKRRGNIVYDSAPFENYTPNYDNVNLISTKGLEYLDQGLR